MDRIEDERVLFYLKHKDLIETWAGVKKDVATAANRFYMSLASDLKQRAPDLGDDVRVWVREGAWSSLGFYREPWYGVTGPLISATFEWHSSATFNDGTRYVGLRSHTEEEGGVALLPHAKREVKDATGIAGFKVGQNWPAYRNAPSPASGAFWEDLSEFRADLVEAVVESWAAFHEPAERAFHAWTAANVDLGSHPA
jgi:hypothetical protein